MNGIKLLRRVLHGKQDKNLPAVVNSCHVNTLQKDIYVTVYEVRELWEVRVKRTLYSQTIPLVMNIGTWCMVAHSVITDKPGAIYQGSVRVLP